MSSSITWQKSDGSTPLAEGASLGVATYYAAIPVGLSTSFAVGLVWDATIVGTFTIEACVSDTPTVYAAVGTGWTTRPSLGSEAAAASASSVVFEVSGASAPRYRVKAVISTGGVVTGTYQCKAA